MEMAATLKRTASWHKRSALFAMFRELLKNKIALLAVIYVGLFYLVGLAVTFEWFGLSVTPYDYREQDYDILRQGPTWAHPFGVDLLGRDLLTRIMYSMRTVVWLTILVVITGGLFLPITLGVIAGYFGKTWDTVIMQLGYILDAVPAFFMILFIILTLRPRYEQLFEPLGNTGYSLIREGIVDFFLIFLVISLFSWVAGARVIRSLTLSLRELGYIDSARVLGASSFRIITRHIIPNLMRIIVLSVAGLLASVITIDLALSFFGLGIRPPNPSFGIMFSQSGNEQILKTSPHLLVIPGSIVILFILSVTYIGMKLQILVNSFTSIKTQT